VTAGDVDRHTGRYVNLGRGNDVHPRATQRSDGRVAEQRRADNSCRHLEVAHVVRRIEAVQRSGAELAEVEVVVPLLGVVVCTQDEDPWTRLGAHDRVDNAAGTVQRGDVAPVGELIDMTIKV
jgi:hypothetical protein